MALAMFILAIGKERLRKNRVKYAVQLLSSEILSCSLTASVMFISWFSEARW